MEEEKPKDTIPLDSVKDKLQDYEKKKEEYRLRHYLHYHLVKKKNTKKTFQIEHGDLKVSFD